MRSEDTCFSAHDVELARKAQKNLYFATEGVGLIKFCCSGLVAIVGKLKNVKVYFFYLNEKSLLSNIFVVLCSNFISNCSTSKKNDAKFSEMHD